MRTQTHSVIFLRQCHQSICLSLFSTVFLFLLLATSPALAQSTEDTATRLYAEIAEKGPYQLELPNQKQQERKLTRTSESSGTSSTSSPDDEVEPESSDDGSWFGDDSATSDLPGNEMPEQNSSKTATTFVLQAAIIITLGFLAVYWLRELFYMKRRQANQHSPVVTQSIVKPVSNAVPARPVSSFENLAADENYGAAIREMLMHCVNSLVLRVNRSNAFSRTNRELMHEGNLSDAAKSAIAVLVASEELSQFGAKELNETVYLKCLAAFKSFNAEMKGG